MKTIGYILIIAGFLIGSLVTVMDETEVLWPYYLVGLAAGIAGVAAVRVALHRETREEGKLTHTLQQVESSLDRIVEAARRLNDRRGALDPYDVKDLIDGDLREDIATFVDGRESIAHVYGLQHFANVMSHFSSGERYINRVWSASADGYIDEVRMHLPNAAAQFTEARDHLAEVRKQASV